MRKKVLDDDEIEQHDEQASRRRDAGGDKLDALGRQLKAARPLLVTCVTPGELTLEGGQLFQLDPWHLDHPLEWDELDREGYDPIGRTPLGPVYYPATVAEFWTRYSRNMPT